LCCTFWARHELVRIISGRLGSVNFEAIETTRLIVRPICVNDAEAFAKLPSSPGALAISIEHARNSIAMAEDALRRRDCILIVLIEKASNQLLGFFAVSRSRETEIGNLQYHMAEEFRGRGYMSEAGPAALKLAEEFLAISEFEAVVNADNAPSIAVLMRMGFMLAGEWVPPVPIIGRGGPCLRFVRNPDNERK